MNETIDGKILVTGGAGFIGSHVSKALLERGILPVALDDLSTGNAWALRYGPLERGDIADRGFLREVFARHRPLAVMHLAGSAQAGEGELKPLRYWSNNLCASVVLLEAMGEAGVRRMIFSSTCAVYGQPPASPVDESTALAPVGVYGRSKLAVEQVLVDAAAAGAVDYVALRYFNAAGADPDAEIGEWHDPETRLIPCVLRALRDGREISIFGTDYPTADGTCVRDYLHVSDIATAHLAALDYLGRGGSSISLNLGTGSGSSVREVIAACERVTGIKAKIIGRDRRPGDPVALFASRARAHQVLGWQPGYPALEDIVATAWKWLERCPELSGEFRPQA